MANVPYPVTVMFLLVVQLLETREEDSSDFVGIFRRIGIAKPSGREQFCGVFRAVRQ